VTRRSSAGSGRRCRLRSTPRPTRRPTPPETCKFDHAAPESERTVRVSVLPHCTQWWVMSSRSLQRATAAAGTVQGLSSITISRSWVNVLNAAKFIFAAHGARERARSAPSSRRERNQSLVISRPQQLSAPPPMRRKPGCSSRRLDLDNRRRVRRKPPIQKQPQGKLQVATEAPIDLSLGLPSSPQGLTSQAAPAGV
jgi:hypothetical protein